jgi:4-hydroxymandelate oxidase
MQRIRERASEVMQGTCRVCPVCDGRACVGEVPGMGGVGTGASFHNNLFSLATHRLVMRCIHDVADPDTRVTLLGRTLELPVLAAPMGGVSFNMGGQVTEVEYLSALLEGCVARGTLGCTGDGAPEFISEAAFGVLHRLAGAAVPFIKPWESEELTVKLRRAVENGARIVGIDVDAVGLVTLRKMGRPVAPRSAAALKELIEQTPAKFVLKGIMTVDQARLAVDVGAGAIVVSNHGGRVLDHVPGAAEVLPAIADAVGGVITILADGGVRSGEDVLKMLALGADAVMIGRPFAVAALGGGREGVEHYINKIYTELKAAMVLTSTRSASNVSRDILC